MPEVKIDQRGPPLVGIHQAIKTLRRIPLFGKRHFAIDFVWPEANHLLAMSLNEPIKLVGLNW